MCVGHHYPQASTNNVNKTSALLQTTGKTGTKHCLCEIYVNITNGVIFFTQSLLIAMEKGDIYHYRSMRIVVCSFVPLLSFFGPLYYLSFDLWIAITL
jgi:hypothetical protein